MTRVFALLLLIAAVSVNCQRGGRTGRCDFKNDKNSPFYWPGTDEVCTKELCATYPSLGCDVDPEYLKHQIEGHYQENITQEVMYLQEYFDTLIPPPVYPNKYRCAGVCDHPPELVDKILTDLMVPDYFGKMGKKRWMCHVIGPKIYHRKCGGECNLLYGSHNAYCIPDVTVSVDVWVFCEDILPGCRKIKMDVPISCSCREFKCLAKRPYIGPIKPKLPDWVQTGSLIPEANNLAPIDIRDIKIDLGPKGPHQGPGNMPNHVDPNLISIAGPINPGHKQQGGQLSPGLVDVGALIGKHLGPMGPHQGPGNMPNPVDPSLINIAGPINPGHKQQGGHLSPGAMDVGALIGKHVQKKHG